MKQFINQNLFSLVVTYAKKNLLEGFLSGRGRLALRNIHNPQSKINIPISCFNRTGAGDIVLYRGINRALGDIKDYSKSVAAAMGKSKNDILKEHQTTIENIASIFSTRTQFGDPILHTTTQRNFAKSLAENGTLIEYHIPRKYLEEHGIIGHLAENEIDFFHSIPNEFIASITKMPTKNISNGLPETIDLSQWFC